MQSSDSKYKPDTGIQTSFANCDTYDEFLEFLNSFRRKNTGCDVDLMTDDGTKIPVHKIVLIKRSQFFKTMFAKDFQEQHERLVHLADVDANTLNLIIDYIYGTKLQVSEDNVEPLLKSSDYFEILSLKTACCDFLKSHLSRSSCIRYRCLADQCACGDLLQICDQYIIDNLHDIANQEDFLLLSFLDLEKLIKNDNIVRSEDMIYRCIVKWMKHDLENREKYCFSLIKNVDSSLLSSECLKEEVIKEKLLCENLECQLLLNRTLISKRLNAPCKVITSKRNSTAVEEVFIYGGVTEDNKISNEAFLLDLKTGDLSRLKPLHIGLAGCGIVRVDEKCYIGGGFDVDILNTCDAFALPVAHIYNLKTNQWQPANFSWPRVGYFGMVILHNFIYVIGGICRKGPGIVLTKSVKKLCLASEQWYQCRDLEKGASHFSTVVFNNMIYVIGGYSLPYFDSSNRVLCYKEQENGEGKWTEITPMHYPRRNAAVAVLNNKLFVVGGDGEIKDVGFSAEVFNFETATWIFVPYMPWFRSLAAAYPVGECLFVFGGINKKGQLHVDCMKYCPKTSKWFHVHDVTPRLPVYGFSSVAIGTLTKNAVS